MTEPLTTDRPPAPDPNPDNFSGEFDPLPIPPLDDLFLSSACAPDPTSSETLTSDLGFFLDDNFDFDFDIVFDDLDDFFPPDAETLTFPAIIEENIDNPSPESGISDISGDRRPRDVEKVSNCSSSVSGSSDRELQRDSGDRCLNFPSPPSSSVSGTGNSFSPDSDKVEIDERDGISVLKRKKDSEDTSGESRSCKYPKSGANVVAAATTSDEEEKRKVRLMRNRESAQLSRQRKKQYVDILQGKVRSLHSTISELNAKISYIMAENVALKQQVSGGVMYPPPPMPYPWAPYVPPYMFRPQGSQVPLVPIPKLKRQESVSGSKVKKSGGKSRTKKVASVSFLGLLFFIFLFGGLVPFVNVRYGGISESFNGGYDRFYDQQRGQVLMVNGHPNGTDSSRDIGFSKGNYGIGHGGSGCHAHPREHGSASAVGNASEPLFASLFVPRNDKLVKIDGNLIINSVLASEKAMASDKASETNNSRETGLTIPRDFSPALAIPDMGGNGGMLAHLYRSPNEHLKALSSGSTDGKNMQQWFREGFAGQMLSSGMCTEVFQFDVSPISSAGPVIPASSVNVSAQHNHDASSHTKGRNRRILHELPVPLTGSNVNITGDQVGKSSQKDSFQGNKSSSSIVVSVLVDPREAGDADIDGMVSAKSISRIFVVVLLDSVKYVTYSCILPRAGLHLVAA